MLHFETTKFQYAFLCARICRKFFVKIFNGTKRSKTLQNFSRLQNFARLCKSFKVFSLQDFAKVLQNFARLCKSFKVLQHLQTIAKLCKELQSFAKSLQQLAKVCKFLQQFAQICTSLQQFAQVCNTLHKSCKTIANLVQKDNICYTPGGMGYE